MKNQKHSPGLLDIYDPEAPYATEFRRLLHSLTIKQVTPAPKTILITSAMLSEGKSTIAAFLSMTSAVHKKKKTLLMDCDLRRPTIHRLFGLERENGITEALIGDRKVREVVKKTANEYLDILTAGKAVTSPTDVFDSTAISRLLEELNFYYDLILIDCAPVLPVSDPMLLASEMDGVLMVVKAGTTQREVVKRAIGLLQSDNSRFLGVVMNNLNNSLPYYYSDGYYGYEYQMPQNNNRRQQPKGKNAPENQPREKIKKSPDNQAKSPSEQSG